MIIVWTINIYTPITQYLNIVFNYIVPMYKYIDSVQSYVHHTTIIYNKHALGRDRE